MSLASLRELDLGEGTEIDAPCAAKWPRPPVLPSGDAQVAAGKAGNASFGTELDQRLWAESERIAFDVGMTAVLCGGALVAATIALTKWHELGAQRAVAIFVVAAVVVAIGAHRLTRVAQGIRRAARRQYVLERELRRYVSPRVAQAIMNRNPGFGQAELRDVTVLFCDLRDFTIMCERQRPEDVVELLNTFYERACQIVQAHGGTVNKFMGDGLLVLFGAPDTHPRPVQAAVEAAHEIMYAAEELRAEGGICNLLDIGISLDCGEVVVGEVGASSRAEYTAIGTAVNRAARLQGIARDSHRRIVLSEDLARRLGPRANLLSMGSVKLKGLRDPVRAYAFRHS